MRRSEREALVSTLGTDKKRQAGRNVWVLLREPGVAQLVDDVSEEEIRAALG